MMSPWAGDSSDKVAKNTSALLGQIAKKRVPPEIILDFKSPLRRPLMPLVPQTSPIGGVGAN